MFQPGNIRAIHAIGKRQSLALGFEAKMGVCCEK